MVVQLFMSHTKRDKSFCDRFDTVAARVGVKVFRSEFEDIKTPAWLTIKEELEKSSALFLLVGNELVKAQELSDTSEEAKEIWKYTQNWIAYEIGLACGKGIDVWVICDSVEINYPIPYLNNYEVHGILNDDLRRWYRGIFESYRGGGQYLIAVNPSAVCHCPHDRCGAMFNLWSTLSEGSMLNCPTCLKPMHFKKGWMM